MLTLRAELRKQAAKYSEAVGDYSSAIHKYRLLVQVGNTQFERELAESFGDRGECFGRLNRPEEAISDLNETIDRCTQLDEEEVRKTGTGTTVPLRTSSIVAHALVHRAHAFIAVKRFAEAMADVEQLTSVCNKASESMGSTLEHYLKQARDLHDYLDRRFPAGVAGDAKLEKPATYWIEKLESGDEAARLTAAQALGQLRANEAVMPLAAVVQDSSAMVRIAAVVALGRIGTSAKSAAPALIATLADAELRDDATYALTRIGGESVPGLVTALRNSDVNVRQASAHVLRLLGPIAQPAVPALAEALRDEDPTVRVKAARALGRIGAGALAAVPALGEALKVPDIQLRRSVLLALGDIGPEAVPALIAALKKDDKAARVEILRALSDMQWEASRVAKAVASLLEDPEEDIRNEAISALASVVREKREEAAAFAPAIAKALKDRQPGVRRNAAIALGRLGVEARATVQDLMTALGDEDRSVRIEAAIALGELGPDARIALPELIKLLQESDGDVLQAARMTIEKMQ